MDKLYTFQFNSIKFQSLIFFIEKHTTEYDCFISNQFNLNLYLIIIPDLRTNFIQKSTQTIISPSFSLKLLDFIKGFSAIIYACFQCLLVILQPLFLLFNQRILSFGIQSKLTTLAVNLLRRPLLHSKLREVQHLNLILTCNFVLSVIALNHYSLPC